MELIVLGVELADSRALEPVARVELHARLIGVHLHHSTRLGACSPSGQPQHVLLQNRSHKPSVTHSAARTMNTIQQRTRDQFESACVNRANKTRVNNVNPPYLVGRAACLGCSRHLETTSFGQLRKDKIVIIASTEARHIGKCPNIFADGFGRRIEV